jgi:hypothetical protein
MILTNLPEGTQIMIPQQDTPRDERVRGEAIFKGGGSNSFLALLACVVIGGGLVWIGYGVYDPAVKTYAGEVLQEGPEKVWGGIALMVVGGVILTATVVTLVFGGKLTVLVTPEGIQKLKGNRREDFIRWGELRSVELLYEYASTVQDGSDSRSWSFGPEVTTYHVIVGSGGNAIVFDSTMPDFEGLLRALVTHAPPHVAISAGKSPRF